MQRTAVPALTVILAMTVSGCSLFSGESEAADAPESASSAVPEDPRALFPEPGDFGAGWFFSAEPISDRLDRNSGSNQAEEISPPSRAAIEEITAATCDDDGVDIISPVFEDELSAEYTNRSGDRVWVVAEVGSDASRAYSLATTDFLSRCSELTVAMPDPSIDDATHTRQFAADPLTGSPTVVLEVSDKLIRLYVFSDDPASVDSIDLLEIAQLLADRA
jgi:hypothetical protein